ncbi:MAG TPA: efflux RND transporter periplasmic adaptor subunit [Anaerovoracaceae bacterium]|nr:efflux RND transporter periplasmic adaptor subunit [Anaerovoracaceae bacterium]
MSLSEDQKTIKEGALKIKNSRAAAVVGGALGKIPFLERINRLSLKKRRLVFISVFLAAILALTTAASGFFNGDEKAPAYTEYETGKGDVSVTISGSGAVEPNAQYNVVSLVEGDVLEDTFQEGDSVSRGAILYKIDSSDMEKTLEKANISYERADMSYQKSLEAYNGLNITAPISGRVTEVLVEKGSSVQNGTRIATIADDSTLTARVSFGASDAENLFVWQPADVTVENTFEVLQGTVSRIYDSKKVLDGYVEVVDVEVTVKNPGALESGTYVTVNAGGVDGYEGAVLEGETEKIVTAKTSGLVSKIFASEGEYLSQGAPIVSLASDSADEDLRSSELSLKESQLSYESTQEQLDEYSITAPISGTVIEKDVKAGDTLESSNSGSTTLCVIADMSSMKFTIDVDELDIASMKEGQEVNITADALGNKGFTGYVSNIGILGTTTDGVTTYPVEIVIKDGEALWPGMNVTAEIVVNSVQNVLKIPVSAVNRGNTVLVKGAEGTEGVDQSSASDGAKYVRVELGLNDESYIEVTKGLSEGDIVLVPVIQGSSEETTGAQKDVFIMGPGGGMPGVPPAGGGLTRSSGGTSGSGGWNGGSGSGQNSGNGGGGSGQNSGSSRSQGN